MPYSPTSRLTPARRRLLDRLLEQILDLEPKRRAEKVLEVQQRAPRLSAWLRELLAADENAEPLFEILFERVGQAAEDAARGHPVDLSPGTRLGPWRVLEATGSGGMGTVYRAERADDAFCMTVAIKLIRMNRASFEERLRLERELLARLDHRNIARLIDGGTTPEGQIYLVMEWVEGRDLDSFVDEQHATLAERLDLFEQIAKGVIHAHQQRVIHGDLKPSNIRVADDGRVCLVDFGVARLIAEDEEAEPQPFKAMTPAFSAPEQLAGQPASTLSDIWALGVMLEWLLSGRVPDISGAQPSATDRPARSPDVPGRMPRKPDLQAILAKACRHSPEGRYSSVERLLDDLRRYRSGFAVRARPRTRWLVLRRFTGRHKLAVGAVAAATTALCLALAGALWQAQEATRERDRASAEATGALFAEEQATRMAEELQAVVDFQEAQLAGIDPNAMGLELRQGLIDQRREALDREAWSADQTETTLRQLKDQLAGVNLTDLARSALDEHILAPALAAIDQQFGEQPLVRARLLQAVAITARGLGLFERALPAQLEALAVRRAWLDDHHPDTIDSIGRTASLYGQMGEREQSLAHHREALQASRDVHGEDHPNTLTALNNFATTINADGDHEQAEQYFREVLSGRRALLGDDHPDTIIAAANLGAALSSQDRQEEAYPYYEEVLKRRIQNLGEDHPNTVRAVANMGMLLVQLDRDDEALPYYETALEGRRRILGNDHPQTLQSINNMGFLLSRMERPEEAVGFYREVIERSRTLLGDRHPNTLIYLNNTGTLYRSMGQLEAAEQLAAEAVESGRAVLAPGHWHLGVFLAGYGLVLADQSRFAEAEDALLEAYALYEQGLGSDHSRTASLVPEFVDLYERWDEQSPGHDHSTRAAEWQDRLLEENP